MLDYLNKILGKDKLNEEDTNKALKDINKIDWNKQTQNSPILGQDTDKTNVQDYSEAKDLIDETAETPDYSKSIASSLGSIGSGMIQSADRQSKIAPPKYGSIESSIGNIPDIASARRKALMDLINKG